MTSTLQPAVAPQAERRPGRWLALSVLVLAVLLVAVDATVLGLATPYISEDLKPTGTQLLWIGDVYSFVIAGLLVSMGSLGDRIGRKRILLGGATAFGAISVLNAYATTPELMILARALLGVAGATLMPATLALIRNIFHDPRERSLAIGVWGATASAGTAVGPVVGGFLLEHFWWGSVFVINIPLVTLGILACALLIPETKDTSAPKVDVLSTLLGIVGLGAFVYGVIEAPSEGWADPLILGAMLGGVLMVVGLVLREKRQLRPMVDLELLQNPTFRWNTVFLILGTFVFMGLMFVLPQYLQVIQGHDAFGTGVRMMPLVAGMIVVAKIVPPLTVKLGTRPLVVAGLLIMSLAMFLGSTTDTSTGYGFTVVWMILTGLGVSLVMVPALDTALGVLPKGKEGTGSGLNTTLRQVGGAIGIALLGSVLNAVFTDRLDTTGVPAQAADAAEESVVAAQQVAGQLNLPELASSAESAFVHGMGTVLLVCGIAGVVAALLAAFKLPDSRNTEETEHTEQEVEVPLSEALSDPHLTDGARK